MRYSSFRFVKIYLHQIIHFDQFTVVFHTLFLSIIINEMITHHLKSTTTEKKETIQQKNVNLKHNVSEQMNRN